MKILKSLMAFTAMGLVVAVIGLSVVLAASLISKSQWIMLAVAPITVVLIALILHWVSRWFINHGWL